MTDIQETLAKLTAYTVLIKLGELEERDPEGLDAAMAPAVNKMTIKDKLDAFREEMGEEHYKNLCNNPSFKTMLDEFIDEKVMKAINQCHDNIVTLCKKHKIEPPTLDEFKCAIWAAKK